jgi:hypothetical protein
MASGDIILETSDGLSVQPLSADEVDGTSAGWFLMFEGSSGTTTPEGCTVYGTSGGLGSQFATAVIVRGSMPVPVPFDGSKKYDIKITEH